MTEQERNERGQRTQPEADPEGMDELGIIRDRPEPAQRETGGRQRQIALGRESDEADHDDRRQHDDDEDRMEDERERAVRSHRNTSA